MPLLLRQVVIGAAIAIGTAALVSAYKNLEMRLEMAGRSSEPVPHPSRAAREPPKAEDLVGAVQKLLAEQERAADRKLELLRTELMVAQRPRAVAPAAPNSHPHMDPGRDHPGTPRTAAASAATAPNADDSNSLSKHYMEENRRLQEQLSRLRREHWRRGLLLDLDNEMSPEEEAEVRRIFDMFDHNRNGCITVKEVQALHLKMGEPLTDTETEDALREMAGLNTDGTGSPEPLKEVSFEIFMTWWKRSHSGDLVGPKESELGTNIRRS